MVAPITGRGARPVFYPITEAGGVDFQVLSELREAHRPRAIIAAHFFGLPQPMSALRQWCDEAGVVLIEDCAHALFGACDGRPIGSWGDYAIGSLTKFLPVPEGGCLVSNRGTARPLALSAPGLVAQLRSAADMIETGVNYRGFRGLNGVLSALFAAKSKRGTLVDSDFASPDAVPVPGAGPPPAYLSIDRQQIGRDITTACRWMAQHLPTSPVVERRRTNYLRLVQATSGFAHMRPLFPQLPAQCAPYVVPLWVDQPDPAYLELRKRGIPLFRWDWLWPGTPEFPGDSGHAWSNHVFQIPCHQDLRETEIAEIAGSLGALCG
jgi:hypothetical protein